MLQVSHLSKRFGALTVLEDVSFTLEPRSRTALVGPNGSGKTTLLRCLAGLEEPDSGQLVTPRGYLVGYLSQTLDEIAGLTIGSVLEPSGGISGEGADGAASPLDPGGRRRIAAALGLSELSPEQSANSLSGGQKTRLALARVLLRSPDALLLDEPTNHLDVDALRWLEEFLAAFAGPVLTVSHDREFLDRTAETVLLLDPATHSTIEYAGNYSAFAAERAREERGAEEAWRRQEEYVARVRRDIAAKKSGARSIEQSTTPRQPGVRRLAKKKAALAKARERKLERYLGSADRVARPTREWSLNLALASERRSSREAIQLMDVSAGYSPGNDILDHASLSLMHADRVGVVGPNGSGKTTLLRVVDGRLAASSGKVWRSSNVSVGTLAQEQETLDPSWSVVEVVRRAAPMLESDARTFLHQLLFRGNDAFKRVADCSPGERSRLQLARLVLGGANVLTLDEPLNHLDIAGRERFEEALSSFAGAVLVVAHDRAFLRSFAEKIVEVRDGTVRLFAGGYEEYEARSQTGGADG